MGTFEQALGASPWMHALTLAQQARVAREMVTSSCRKGGTVCRRDERVEHWYGVVEGMVKLGVASRDGRLTTFAGIPAGSWFGEGSLLNDSPCQYDAVALRDCQIAKLPRATFLWLLDCNPRFGDFLLQVLTERVDQFSDTIKCHRLGSPEARVAHSLASLYNPVLSPHMTTLLTICQDEIARLAGLSRQRVNRSIKALAKRGLLRIEYGGVTILDLDSLRQFDDEPRGRAAGIG